jgi:uncharacterized protein (TIGR02099 family)
VNRPELPHSISDVGATVHRIEEVVEHSIEHGVEVAEQSIARRFGLRALRGVRIALKTVAWLLVATFFAFGTLLLVTRYWVLPRIDEWRPRVEAIASRVLKAPLTVGRLEASWRGFNPHLALNDVRVGRDEAKSLTLPRVEATVSWSSVLVLAPRFSYLRILAPELVISRLAGGRYSIAGFVLDPTQAGDDSRAMDWILAQGRVVVRDARIRYRDERQSPAREIELTDVNLLLESSFNAHSLGLQATPPAAIAGPLDVRGRIRYDPLGRRSDIKEWSGEIYAEVGYADIAALVRLADLPFDVTHAHGAVRSWLSFDNALITRISADLALKDVDARLAADLDPLALSSLQGRITVRQWKDEASEPGGQELVLNRLTFDSAAGQSFPPLDMKLRQTRASERIPQQTQVEASRINLEGLAALAKHVPLPREVRDNITRHAIRGTLSNLTASWKGPTPEAGGITLKAQFAGLASAGQPGATEIPEAGTAIGRPGFENLTGSVEVADGSGWLQLAAKDAVLVFPGVFEDPKLGFDRINASVRWKSQPSVELRIESLQATNRDLDVNVTGSYRAAETGPGTVDLSGRIARFDATAAHRYVPRAVGRGTIDWLKHGLVKGRLGDASLRLRGDLAQFPFKRPADGEFRIAGKVTDATLDVAPGAALDGGKPAADSVWPLLTGIDADIAFDRASMTINAQRGSVYDARIQNTSARIADLGRDALLEVRGQAAGPLADMIRYVNASPVAGWIGDITQSVDARGNARLDLRLDIPLTASGSTRVAGAVQLAANDVKLAGIPPFSRVNGTLGFTERGVRFNNLSAGFVGGTSRLDAQTRADGATVVTAAGTLTPVGLRTLSEVPMLRRVLDRMQGTARYNASLTIHQGTTQLQIDSDLIGLAIDGVAPLRKSAAESMPLRVDRATPGGEREDLRASLGKLLGVQLERRRENNEFRLTRGVVALNTPANLPESGLLLNISLPRFDVEAWSDWLGEDSSAATAQGAPTPASAEPPVDYIALQTQELVIMRRSFRNLTLGASLSKGGLVDANISSDNLVGQVSWRPGPAGSVDSAGLGRIRAHLSKLVIPNAQKDNVATVLRAPTRQLPSIELTADNFDLGEAKLGRLDLVARNTGTGASAAWRLRRLDITNPDVKFAATGDWLASTTRQTTMKFKLDVADAGGTLTRLGFGNTMVRGQGTVEGALDWTGSPLEIDYPTLSGNFTLKIDNGRFLKVETGGPARLVSLLSLQSLARTLGTEARETFGAGFEFTSIVADAAIARGVLTTQNFRMVGQSAAVLMSGTIDLSSETQKLLIVVLPEIDASTAALALAVVNPIVGLGTFLAQSVLRNPLSKALALEFDVTGTWTEPVVTRRSRITPNSQEAVK